MRELTGRPVESPSPSEAFTTELPEGSAVATTSITSTQVQEPADLPSQNAVVPAETEPLPTEMPPIASPSSGVQIAPPTFPARSNEEKWREQQSEREIFDAPRRYTTVGSELWWFDPVNQQHVILGSFSGEFDVQATFTLHSQGVVALEVPYPVNQRYVTAISPAHQQRIAEAGFGEWIETYVFLTPNVRPLS